MGPHGKHYRYDWRGTQNSAPTRVTSFRCAQNIIPEHPEHAQVKVRPTKVADDDEETTELVTALLVRIRRHSLSSIMRRSALLCLRQAMTDQQRQQRRLSKTTKELWIVRHGQATHNPRAEAARANGCSFEHFLELMRQDDSLDSELTDLGIEQAKGVHGQHKDFWLSMPTPTFDLVVASPLSRAIHTADLAVPFEMASNRICHDYFREVNGSLLNGKRRTRTELSAKFPEWDFSLLTCEEDDQWTEEFETPEACRERGFQGLSWMLSRSESRILLASHGGVLRQLMAEFPDKVIMCDGRSEGNERPVVERFENCEVRRYSLEWEDAEAKEKIVLTEMDVL
eukprot:scaffold34710_cov208-Amphora_coffeaeformis.AAC.2